MNDHSQEQITITFTGYFQDYLFYKVIPLKIGITSQNIDRNFLVMQEFGQVVDDHLRLVDIRIFLQLLMPIDIILLIGGK